MITLSIYYSQRLSLLLSPTRVTALSFQSATTTASSATDHPHDSFSVFSHDSTSEDDDSTKIVQYFLHFNVVC